MYLIIFKPINAGDEEVLYYDIDGLPVAFDDKDLAKEAVKMINKNRRYPSHYKLGISLVADYGDVGAFMIDNNFTVFD